MAVTIPVPISERRRPPPLLPRSWAREALGQFLKRLIHTGSLTVLTPVGGPIIVGDNSSEPIVVRIHHLHTLRHLVGDPHMALGEAYMDGGLTIERGTLWAFLDLIGHNLQRPSSGTANPYRRLKHRLEMANRRDAARRNVAHHYDLSLDLYRRFLDDDLQYSCAYFARADMTLEEAQQEKKRRLAAKLLLEPGLSVLDIGCGWGGLGLTLAGDYGAKVTGITLSKEQLAVAQARAKAKNLDDQARFRLEDYRDVEGRYDRIVSVGMFEHVGVPNYEAYFEAIARLLTDDGVAVVHSIGQTAPSGESQPWVNKYIFPGGYTPALSEVLPAIERAGLWVTDIEILRLHYAETLRAWRQRFEARRDEIRALYDERFCRMWEFYLALSEIGFRHRGNMVFQIQLTKRVDAVPLTRSYLAT